MAYSTREDVEHRLSATPSEGKYEEVDARIEAGIEYADARIDSRLAGRYAVPFATPPVLIKHISADLAAAFSLDGAFSGGGEEEPTSLADSLRRRAEVELDKLATGENLLNAPPPDPESTGVIPMHSRLGQRPTLEDFDLYNEPRKPRRW